MYKRLIAFNLGMILLVTAVYIVGYYFINYPMKFDLWFMIKECGLQYLAAVFVVTALASYLISSLDFKKLNFKSKFLSVFPLLNFLAMAFFIYIAAEEFIKNKKALSIQENHYIREAEKDIKNDLIVSRYSGFALPPSDEKKARLIHNIYRKYGIVLKNTGCIIEKTDNKAQEKYTELTDAYLEKRNGKGWKDKMKKEIDEVEEINNPKAK